MRHSKWSDSGGSGRSASDSITASPNGLFALILWNEASDLWVERWPERGMQYTDGLKDIFLTMFVPTVLMVAFILRRQLSQPRTAKRRFR